MTTKNPSKLRMKRHWINKNRLLCLECGWEINYSGFPKNGKRIQHNIQCPRCPNRELYFYNPRELGKGDTIKINETAFLSRYGGE